ncbi:MULTISPECIES: hypothetical protein [Paraburkholderia]|jgi:hypothetical protein|uniref:hypothetical protein n=1 Tax=Paraburkholderia TaxID=1822464 RepID=UPI001CB36992|nr:MULTISPECIES: hypothetical protein [Paraburkholderia]GJH02340.1 hypothetical protein CBA19C8_17305 [Paraburkholderia terrae]GJH35491.1 hypothetical protein CBA19CS91_22060 [Paraburkholderia hospita]CAG9251998.1 conserved membrane hypothetical protein [Paraburkholderia caribensis]
MNGVWATVIGSGIFHGVNPAMGWLFAAALGLQHGSRKALLMALPPLALGHAVAVMFVTTSAVAFGLFARTDHLRMFMGVLLIAWAAYHHFYGHKQRVRVGMTAGFVGLALWSAAMATMHGAGLMLLPALLPLCGAGMPIGSSLESVGQVTAVHTVVTLATASAIALAAYQYLGLGMLRRGWINFDWLWCGALTVTGVLLIVTG